MLNIFFIYKTFPTEYFATECCRNRFAVMQLSALRLHSECIAAAQTLAPRVWCPARHSVLDQTLLIILLKQI